MWLKALHVSKHTVLTLLEITIGAMIMLVVLIAITLWKFSSGPVDVSWVKPYLQSAIADGQDQIHLDAASIVAEWSDFSGPLSLGVSDFKLYDGTRKLLDVNKVGIRLSKAALLIGQISPEALIIDNPSLKIIRDQSGKMRLALKQADDSDKSNKSDDLSGYSLKEWGDALYIQKGLLSSSPFGIWSDLERFELKNADLIAEDHITGVTWLLDGVNIGLNRTKKTFALDVSVPHASQKERSHLNLTATRRNKKNEIDLTVSSFDVGLMSKIMSSMPVFVPDTMSLRGNIHGEMDRNWVIETLNGSIGADQLNSPQLNASSPTEKNNSMFAVSAVRKGDTIPLTLSLKTITLEQIAALWPKGYEDHRLTDWLTRRLQKGTIQNISFIAPFEKNKITGDWALNNSKTSFDFMGATVDYNAPMAPVLNGSGSAKIENDALKITVTGGTLGGLTLKGGSVEITNLSRPDPTIVTIHADANGSLSNVLGYIYRPPVSLKEKVGIDEKQVRGNADAKVLVTFPGKDHLKIDDVKVEVDAILDDAFVPHITNGLDMAGGPYTIAVRNGQFSLKGNGTIGGQTGTFDYIQYFDLKNAPFDIELKANVATNEMVREAFGIKLDMFVNGVIPADIYYKETKNNEAIVDVKADVTNSNLKLDALRYVKPAGRAGMITAHANVKDGNILSINPLKINAGNDRAEGQILFGKFGAVNLVKSGKFSNVNLGDANNFDLDFTQNTLNDFTFNVRGASLDARPFLGNGNTNLKASGQNKAGASQESLSSRVNINVATLRGGNAAMQVVKNAQARIDVDRNDDIRYFDLAGRVQNAPIKISIKPNQENKLALSVYAQNAGSFLNAFNIYDKMQGGELKINATQITGAGVNDFRGVGEITNFKVVKAPILAKLINAFSLTGILDLLSNQGIEFKKMSADFDWRTTRDGRIIAIRNGKTSGASIGLTFGGVLNQDQGNVNLSGTVVPISDVNKIVSKIPLVGELLTGGKNGGVIAATYAIKGPTEDPSVLINPLSVLAPGFLRSILFEDNNGNPVNNKKDGGSSAPSNQKGYN